MPTQAQKITLIFSIVFLMVFLFMPPFVAAAYNPLECSYYYNGFCTTGGECFETFGDEGIEIDGFCFNVSGYYPYDFTITTVEDLDTPLEFIADTLDRMESAEIFMAKILSFWLPFGVILNFSMAVIYMILLKFKFFR